MRHNSSVCQSNRIRRFVPSNTQQALCVKSILTSHTRWPVTFDHPCGALSLESSTSKVTLTLNISLVSASHHRELLFLLLISITCATLVGVSIPYLCVVFHIQVFTKEKITSLFLSVYGTHHANAASSDIPLTPVSSAISTGWDCFISTSVTHDSVPSFQWTNNFQPAIIHQSRCCPLLIVMCLSSLDTAMDLSFE